MSAGAITSGPIAAADGFAIMQFPSRAEMGLQAARDIAAEMRKRLAQQAEIRMIFGAAPSQSEVLAALAAMPDLAWDRVIAFHMDEYVGLPAGAPERFAEWLDTYLFGRLNFKAVHKIVPEPDAEIQAQHYASLLAEAPIDIVCLGIGVNGHIAFNDPPVADFNDPQDVKVVELDDICRQQQVDDKCFATFDDVPRHALTLTVPRLLRAGRMFCVVPGAVKRNAVIQALYGPISTACPASILRTQSHCTLYLDAASAPGDGR